MKICIKCGREKDDNNFYFRDRDLGTRFNTCKDCIKEYKELNRDKIKLYQQEYDRIYYQNNKEEILEYNGNYLKTNKEKVLIQKGINDKNRRNADPAYRLRKDCSRMIWAVLKDSKNNSSILDYLPYNMQELKVHLEKQFEPWMTWENQGKYDPKIWDDSDRSTWTWQLDHIIPQSKLPYSSMTDDNFQRCWALENLRPLSAKQNIVEGSNRLRHK